MKNTIPFHPPPCHRVGYCFYRAALRTGGRGLCWQRLCFRTSFFVHMYVPWLSQYVLLLGCGLLGFYRIVAIHPVFQAEYRHWLEAVRGRPASRYQLVPFIWFGRMFDVLLLIGTLLCDIHISLQLSSSSSFLFTYLIGGRDRACPAASLGIAICRGVRNGRIVLVRHNRWPSVQSSSCFMSLPGLSYDGRLRDFPWNIGTLGGLSAEWEHEEQQRQTLLGCRFQSLSPGETAPSMPLHTHTDQPFGGVVGARAFPCRSVP